MISETQSGFTKNIHLTTADTGVQGFPYPQDAVLGAGSAIKTSHDQSAIASTGLLSSGADAAVIVILLVVMIYGLARWLRRRTLERSNDVLLLDSKLDPAKIHVRHIRDKP